MAEGEKIISDKLELTEKGQDKLSSAGIDGKSIGEIEIKLNELKKKLSIKSDTENTEEKGENIFSRYFKKIDKAGEENDNVKVEVENPVIKDINGKMESLLSSVTTEKINGEIKLLSHGIEIDKEYLLSSIDIYFMEANK